MSEENFENNPLLRNIRKPINNLVLEYFKDFNCYESIYLDPLYDDTYTKAKNILFESTEKKFEYQQPHWNNVETAQSHFIMIKSQEYNIETQQNPIAKNEPISEIHLKPNENMLNAITTTTIKPSQDHDKTIKINYNDDNMFKLYLDHDYFPGNNDIRLLSINQHGNQLEHKVYTPNSMSSRYQIIKESYQYLHNNFVNKSQMPSLSNELDLNDIKLIRNPSGCIPYSVMNVLIDDLNKKDHDYSYILTVYNTTSQSSKILKKIFMVFKNIRDIEKQSSKLIDHIITEINNNQELLLLIKKSNEINQTSGRNSVDDIPKDIITTKNPMNIINNASINSKSNTRVDNKDNTLVNNKDSTPIDNKSNTHGGNKGNTSVNNKSNTLMDNKNNTYVDSKGNTSTNKDYILTTYILFEEYSSWFCLKIKLVLSINKHTYDLYITLHNPSNANITNKISLIQGFINNLTQKLKQIPLLNNTFNSDNNTIKIDLKSNEKKICSTWNSGLIVYKKMAKGYYKFINEDIDRENLYFSLLEKYYRDKLDLSGETNQ